MDKNDEMTRIDKKCQEFIKIDKNQGKCGNIEKIDEVVENQ